MNDLIVIKPKKKWLIAIYIIVAIIIYSLLELQIIVISKSKIKKVNYEFALIVTQESENIENERKQKIRRLYSCEEPLTEEQVEKVLDVYNSSQKRVFLTFDDGPTKNITPQILDILNKRKIKASFFVLGQRVKQDPEVLKRIYNEGHYIGNHGYTHDYKQIYSSVESAIEEYNKTEEEIRKALGKPNFKTKIFRFPGGLAGGKYNDIKHEIKDVFLENNVAFINWNSLSNDSGGGEVTYDSIMQNVKDTAGEKNSVVLLMHDAANKQLTVDTLNEVIDYFEERGYTFYNMYDLIGID